MLIADEERRLSWVDEENWAYNYKADISSGISICKTYSHGTCRHLVE